MAEFKKAVAGVAGDRDTMADRKAEQSQGRNSGGAVPHFEPHGGDPTNPVVSCTFSPDAIFTQKCMLTGVFMSDSIRAIIFVVNYEDRKVEKHVFHTNNQSDEWIIPNYMIPPEWLSNPEFEYVKIAHAATDPPCRVSLSIKYTTGYVPIGAIDLTDPT